VACIRAARDRADGGRGRRAGLLGGLIQVDPIWQYGPYEPSLGTNGAQPDWYLGWLIGALRPMPGFDIHFLNHTWVPNPFWGGRRRAASLDRSLPAPGPSARSERAC
jgi:hypothetical protein